MNNRDVEACSPRFARDKPWICNPVPISCVTGFKIYISLPQEECVETEIFFTNIESGLSSITNHCVQPFIYFLLGFPCSIVLSSALNIFRIERIHTEALEL